MIDFKRLGRDGGGGVTSSLAFSRLFSPPPPPLPSEVFLLEFESWESIEKEKIKLLVYQSGFSSTKKKEKKMESGYRKFITF